MGGRMHSHLLSLGTVLLPPCAGKLPLADDSTPCETEYRNAASSGCRGSGSAAVRLRLGDLPDDSFAPGTPAWIPPIPVRRPHTEGQAAHLRWYCSGC